MIYQEFQLYVLQCFLFLSSALTDRSIRCNRGSVALTKCSQPFLSEIVLWI